MIDSTESRVPTVSVRGASKRFAGVTALNDVSLDLWPGEVHALVGENGAGKSTLIKLITGVYQLDEGEVRYRGQVAHFRSASRRPAGRHPDDLPRGAPRTSAVRRPQRVPRPRAAPVRVDRPAPDEPRVGRDPRPVRHRGRRQASARRARPRRPADGGRGAGGVRATPSVVIMDEPTSSLEPREVDKLLNVVGLLKEQGVAIVYVSHKLDEIFRACDKVTVLRDGKLVSTGPVAELNRLQLISAHARPRRLRPRDRRAPSSAAAARSRPRSRCSRPRACSASSSSRTSRWSCARARSSAWPACSARAAARRPRPSSAPCRSTRAP